MNGADNVAVGAERTDANGGAMSKAEAREILREVAAALKTYVYEFGQVPNIFSGLEDAERMRLACQKAVAALTRSIKSTKRAKKAGIERMKAAKNADGGAV